MSSGLIAIAAVVTAAAVWVGCRPSPASVLRRRLHPPQVRRAQPLARLRRPGLPTRQRGDRAVQAHRLAVIELCAGMADELRCGRIPVAALLACLPRPEGRSSPGAARDVWIAHTAAAARSGAPVAPAMARDAAVPGAEGLRLVAACWSVAEEHGVALAAALDRVREALRADEVARRRVAVELAAPRASVRLLAVLPLLGLVVGTLSGANPVRVLFGTTWGWGLLVAGIGLDVAGVIWVRRLARSAAQG